MRIISMDEAIEKVKADRQKLSKDDVFLYHDSEEWKMMGKGGQDEKNYYMRIYESLSRLQQVVLAQHAADITCAAKHRETFWSQVQNTQTYQLLRSTAELGYSALIVFAGAPLCMINRPLNTFYAIAWFGTVYTCLFIANILFLIAHVLGIGKLVRVISDRQGRGFSPINWLNINLFNRQKPVIDHAREAFSSDLVNFEPVINAEVLHPKNRKLRFNVDVARSILLMCSIVYERDVSYVKKAASGSISKPVLASQGSMEPNEGVLFLLKSEEAMYRLATEWGLKFVSMADFRMLTGPFAGAFYDYENIGENENPFIVIVMKGTSPDNFSEWLMDCASKFESCGDFLGEGMAHGGFYNTLFPSRASGTDVLPYMRMVETVRMIAGEAAKFTQARCGVAKKTNLFVGGHSLGAGIAQLLYARFLESPKDLGPDVVLRDGYVFGTPRACDFKLASRVEYNLNQPSNQGRQLWRVANRSQSPIIGDIVTRVPPGFADKRENRAGFQDGSFYAYAAIGIRVDLTPNATCPPFYAIENLPVGYKAEVYKKADEAELEFDRSRLSSKFILPRDMVQMSMWLVTVCAPILHDHFPASYMESLCKMQAKTAYGKSMTLKSGQTIKQQQQALKKQQQGAKSIEMNNAPATNTLSPGRDKSE